MGNNPPLPPAFCVTPQLGPDSDVVVWEWGMMTSGPLKLAYIELWLRNALYMPKQPALMFLDPGEGARKPDKEGKLPTEPHTQKPGEWTKEFVNLQGKDLLRHYKDFGPHVQAMYEAVWMLDTKAKYNYEALVRN